MHTESITTSKRLISNTVLNMLNSALTALSGFFLIGFLIKHLGQQHYGIWVLIASIFQFRILLDMGLNTAVNRFIPVCLVRQDNAGINKVISTSFFFFCCLSVILLIASIVVYSNIDTWFKIEPELVQSAKYLVLVVGLCFSLVMPIQMSGAILSGIQRYDIINFASIFTLLAKTTLLIVLVLQGYGLLTVGFLFAGSEILTRLIQFYFSYRLFPKMVISFRDVDKSLLFDMVAYGINSMLYAIGIMVFSKASSIIIGIFLGTAEISYFSVSLAGVLFLSQIIQTFSRAIKPAASDLGARDDNLRLNEMAYLSQKYSLLMLIPAGCFFIVMGKEFLTIWVGDAIGDVVVINMMATILAILTVANCLRLAQHSNYVVLVGIGEHRLFGVLMAVNAVLFIIFAIVCLKVFELGLISVAWSFFVPMILISGIFLPVYFRYKRQISFVENVKRTWYPAFLGSFPAVALIVLWKYLAPPASWLEIAAVVISVGIITLICSCFLSLSKNEKNRFKKLLKLTR